MINVLPEQQKNKLKKQYRIRLVSTYFFLFGILSILTTLLLLPTYILSKSKESFFIQELVLLEKENPNLSLNELQNIISDINNKLFLLDGVHDSMVTQDVINKFLEIPSTNIEIYKIFYTKPADNTQFIEISGIAKDRASLSAYKSSLEKSGLYKKVDLPISNFVEKTDIGFNIKLELKIYE